MIRRLGLAAAVAATVAAGTAAGIVVERRVVRRARSAPDAYADEPFGHLRTAARSVLCDDGVELHAEVDGDLDSDLTVVFVHGFTLSMDCWHFQRRDLADVGRLLFYDQRSHGASGRSPREHSTVDQLGSDLQCVLDALAPSGPVVLVGHSMGGMTILALADQYPELFGSRVRGVALVGTSAGALAQTVFGIPGFIGRALVPVAPGVIRTLNRRADIVEHGRRASSDVAFLLTRQLAFGSPVPASLVDFMDQMLSGTSFEVMTEFIDTFLDHDKLEALDVLNRVPTLILCGDRDRVTPPKNSKDIADALPTAELVVVPDGGHMVMLEHAEAVNEALRQLFERARNHVDVRSA